MDPQEMEMARPRAEMRLRIVEALLRAIELGWPLIEAIEESDDRRSAAARLQQPPFDFDPIEAEHVIDLFPSQRTREGRENLAAEREELAVFLAQS